MSCYVENMIEYRIEYAAVTRTGQALFRLGKYCDGRFVQWIGNGMDYIGATRNLLNQILEGEVRYLIVPQTVKEIKFH